MIACMSSSEELLLAYQRGDDREALTALVGRIHKPAYRRALFLLADPAAADDAVQEALISLVRGAKRFRGGGFASWWGAILRNAIRDEARKLKAKTRRDARAGLMRQRADALRGEAEDERLDALKAALAELPFELREAVVLRYFENQSRREIARALGVSERTTTTRLRHGLEQLRVRLTASCAALTKVEVEALLRRLGGSPLPSPALPNVTVLERAALEAKVLGLLAKSALLFLALGLAGLVARPLFETRPTPELARRPFVSTPPPLQGGGAPGNQESRSKAPLKKAESEAPPETPEENRAARAARRLKRQQRLARPGVAKEESGSAAKGAAAAPAYALTVRVQDERGAPVGGARVQMRQAARLRLLGEAFNRGKRLGREKVCDERGEVRLLFHDTPEPEGHVIAGYARDLSGAAPFPSENDVLVLTLRSALAPPSDRGSLVVAVPGRLSKTARRRGLSLSLTRKQIDPPAKVTEGYRRRLDDKGQLYFGDLKEGAYELSVLLGRGSVKRSVMIRAGRVTRLVLEKPKEGWILGALRLPAGAGSPSLRLTPGSSAGAQIGDQYRFIGLKTGRYRIRMTLPGYPIRELPIEVKPGQNKGPELAFDEPSHSLTGRISHKSLPAAGVEVRLHHASQLLFTPAITGADGGFAFRAVPPGRYRLYAERMDKGRCTLSMELSITEDRELGELSLQAPALLEVAVTDAQGAPAPGARVEIQLSDRFSAHPRSFDRKVAEVDGEGRAAINELWPGIALVRARRGGFFSAVAKVELASGRSTRLNLRLDAPAASLEGVLLGRAAKADLVVHLECPGPFWGTGLLTKKSSADGRFAFEGLPPGRYDLKIEGGLQRSIELGSGRRALRIDLDDFPARLGVRAPWLKRDGLAWIAVIGEGEDGLPLEVIQRLVGSSTLLEFLPEGDFEVAVTAQVDAPDGGWQSVIKRGRVQLRRDLEANFNGSEAPAEGCGVVRGRAELPEDFVLVLRGPVEVRPRVGPNGRFAAYLPPGRYRAYACRWQRGFRLSPTPSAAPSFEIKAGQRLELGAIPLVK